MKYNAKKQLQIINTVTMKKTSMILFIVFLIITIITFFGITNFTKYAMKSNQKDLQKKYLDSTKSYSLWPSLKDALKRAGKYPELLTEPPNLSNCKRTKNAVVTLLELKDLKTFLSKNYEFLKQKYQDRIIIFTTESEDKIETFNEIEYELVDIRNIFNSYPIEFDYENSTTVWSKRNKWSYHHMIRFFFKDIFVHVSMCDINYMLRLDSDSILKINENPFKRMKNEKIYMYNREFYDLPFVVVGLKQFIKDYIRLNKIKIKNKMRWGRVFRGESIAAFYNNFEICKISFFLNPEIQKLINIIDLSHEIFIHRWGDATLRYLILSIFCEEKYLINIPNEWDYYHPWE